ncbi:MAG TPA: dipeptidase [Candidatus Paceibacterota bacterium]|nr:dipeptidase [Verrucomicrobiota bacterium]HOX01853.1 dipeptidase [Verrucomicrobiota bacterium]HRZ44809.1 dipeptidase [Candidatus Paceibacterota bacterium]
MQNVLDYIRTHRERFENELIEYLRIPSVSAQSSHQPDMQACAGWIASHARQIGLRADVIPTAGHPAVLARTFTRRTLGRPHFVVYGHYDVQPPEPLDLWKSPPFEPRRAGRRLYARGASDNKGQHFAHLKAVEACLRSGAGLPVDLTFLIEGEEEVGSRSLPAFLRQHRRELRCEAFVISDTGIPGLQHPALTYALRGIAAAEITLTGPSRDLHSGIHGGAVDNPALALCQLLAQLRDPHGRITVPGFYKDVRPLTAYERRELDRIPHSDAAYRRFLGAPRLFGEHGFTTSERRTARPTLEINGLTSGYQGQGSKTIIPSWARAKLTLRLVPDQRPSHVIRSLVSHLRRLCPPTVRIEIKSGHGGEPYCMSPRHPLAQAALRALQAAFNRPPVLMREGGSIPIVNDFKRILGADSLLLGLALPDADAHAPNENFHLDCFERGIALGACLWPELARAC